MRHRKCIVLLLTTLGFAQAADQHNKVLDRVSSLQKLAAKTVLSLYQDPRECIEHLPPDVSIKKCLVREILKPYKVYLTRPESQVYKTNIRTFAYHPDGRYIATSSVQDASNIASAIVISDLATGQLVALLEGHIGDIATLAFNGDGTQLASGGNDNIVRIWDCHQWKEVKQLQHDANIFSLCFNPQVKNQLACTELAGQITVRNIVTNEEIFKTFGIAETYNASGSRLVINRGNEMHICDTVTWRSIQQLEHNDLFYMVAFNVNDQLAASCCAKVIIQTKCGNTWEVASGRIPKVAYNPKGDRLIVGGEGNVGTAICDTSSWNYVRFDSPFVRKITYHPHNKQFALLTGSNALIMCTLSSYKKTLEKITIDQATYVLNMIRKRLACDKEVLSLEEFKTYSELPYHMKDLLRFRLDPAH